MSTASAEPRYKFDPEYPGTRVLLPGGGHWAISLFLLLWISGWAAGETFAVRALFDAGSPVFVKLFLVVWLTGWTAGGLFAITVALLPWLGREELRVAVGERQVQHFQGLGRLGRTRHWSLHEVQGMQLAQGAAAGKARALPLGGGLLLRLAEGKTVRIGSGLSPQDSASLLQELQQRHSTFKPHGED